MSGHVHFAILTGWLSLGIGGLLWIVACAVVADKMEREGITFWKGFLACLLVTPLVGLLAVGIARSMRPNRPLVQTVTRG
jgi:ABC-type uncharacterized transport system permease subunit